MIAISATSAKILNYLQACANQGIAPDRIEIMEACECTYSQVARSTYTLLGHGLIVVAQRKRSGKYCFSLAGEIPRYIITREHRQDDDDCDGIPRTYAQMARYGY